MPPFNKILTLPEVQKRLNQFDEEIQKLSSAFKAHNTSTARAMVARRATALLTQLVEYGDKVEAVPAKNNEQQAMKDSAKALLESFKEKAQQLKVGYEVRSRQSSVSSSLASTPASNRRTHQTRSASGVEEQVSQSNVESCILKYQDSESSSDSSPPAVSSRPRPSMSKILSQDSDDSASDSEPASDRRGAESQPNPPASPPPPLMVVQPPANSRAGPSRPASQDRARPKPQPRPSARRLRSDASAKVGGNTFLVLGDWAAEQRTDLTIQKGDILKVLETRDDGWWKASNPSGKVGLVPKTFLKYFDPTEAGPLEHIKVRPALSICKLQPRTPAKAVMATPAPQIQSLPSIEVPSSRVPKSLGEALSRDRHLTAECHLAPRLSESNLAFHDLYWNFEDDKLRKRRVKISKLLRVIRLEGMPEADFDACLLRIALLDLSQRTGRQIVSNVHTMKAVVNGSTWTFSNKSGTVLETALGVAKLPLLWDNGALQLTNRTYLEHLVKENVFDRAALGGATKSRLVLRVQDIPNDLIAYVDSLPDILILHPAFARLVFFYRRRLAEALIRDREDQRSAELFYDGFLATFPRAVDQPDLLDYCRKAFQHKYKQIAKRPESEQTATFFNYYMETVFPLIDTVVMPPYVPWSAKNLDARKAMFDKHAESVLEHKGNVEFLLTAKSRPLNIYQLAIDLLGPHAID